MLPITPLELLLALPLSFILAGFLVFALTSRTEGHRRAARLSGILTAITLLVLFALLLFPRNLQIAFAIGLGLALLTSTIFLAWSSGEFITPSPPPNARVDERTTIFARARLKAGSPQYQAYYQDHPEQQALDDRFRANPGLLALGALFYDDLLAASPEGSFFLTEALRDAVDGPVSLTVVSRPPQEMTALVKGLAAYHGAADCGICQLQPYHLYSNIGRGSGPYGTPITLAHRYAIAISVEMDHAMLNSAPHMPTVMESARQYARSGQIAVILAAAIRALGYPARAHIDGNYRVIAPLVAKDAGLGEIGRMGLLMTPRLGPRVRLAVVTTDLPLSVDAPTWDPTVIDFCSHCTKCAAVCPAQAIPAGDRETHPDGTLRWKINPERCYTYWTKIGTDCGRCMAVCPYAHADSPLHNLIRSGVAHSDNFRRAAVWLDDLFYGKKPPTHKTPPWVQDFSNK